MITITGIANWLDAGEWHAERTNFPGVFLHVTNIDEAIAFYQRVFGFRRCSSCTAASAGAVALHASDLTLVLRQWPAEAGSERPPPQRWAFIVAARLDEVRGRVSKLGVTIGAPDQVSRRAGDSFYVCDMDGNEIELVELRPAFTAELPSREAPRPTAAI